MRHLIKKYIKKIKLNKEVINVINSAEIDLSTLNKISETKLENYNAFGITTDNEFVQTFKYNHNDVVFLIAEPDPIVIYYDIALRQHSELKKLRKKLMDNLGKSIDNVFAVNGDFYSYFATSTLVIIYLFLALEAFINKIIPNDFIYIKEIQNRKTEIYNKSQIQKYIDFLEKIKDIVPQIENKNFAHKFGHKFEQIKHLKEFRDDIVHTKSNESELIPNFYQELFNKSIDYNYDNAFNAVKDFINYYENDLIQECNCTKENGS